MTSLLDVVTRCKQTTPAVSVMPVVVRGVTDLKPETREGIAGCTANSGQRVVNTQRDWPTLVQLQPQSQDAFLVIHSGLLRVFLTDTLNLLSLYNKSQSATVLEPGTAQD